MTQCYSLALLFALTAACATAGDDDGSGGTADSSVSGNADASLPGTPDASLPGTPDASVPGTPDAGITPVEVTLSLSTNATTITALNTVSCNDETTGQHTDNSYYRVFDLTALGVTSAFTVSKISMGIETATGAAGTQPATVRLHTLNGALTLANLTQIGTAAATITDTAVGVVIDIPVTGVAPAASTLVVEFFTPNGQTAGHSLFVGSNALGQSGPSYLAATDCGAAEPADLAGLGFPDVHVVMTVTGTHLP